MVCFTFCGKPRLEQWLLSCCWAVLHRAGDISASHTVLWVSVLVLPKNLGGGRIRTAALNWQEGYSLPCDVTENYECEGIWIVGCHCCLWTDRALVSRWSAASLLCSFYLPVVVHCSFSFSWTLSLICPSVSLLLPLFLSISPSICTSMSVSVPLPLHPFILSHEFYLGYVFYLFPPSHWKRVVNNEHMVRSVLLPGYTQQCFLEPSVQPKRLR